MTVDCSVRQEKKTSKKVLSSNFDREAIKVSGTIPINWIGREDELDKLNNFIQSHFKNKSSGSMYIYGAAGTGKFACLSNIMLKSELKEEFNIVYINCTQIRSVTSIYSKICEELQFKMFKSDRNYKELVEDYLSNPHTMLLLILHDLDHVKTRNQIELCSLFKWALTKNSKFVLIGVASSFDVMDKLLPKLDTKCELGLSLLHFQQY